MYRNIILCKCFKHRPKKNININKNIETKYGNSEPSLGPYLDYKSRNKNLVEKIVLQNRLEIIITKSVLHQGPESIPLHNEIDCQINQNDETVNFVEAPKPSVNNYVNVT